MNVLTQVRKSKDLHRQRAGGPTQFHHRHALQPRHLKHLEPSIVKCVPSVQLRHIDHPYCKDVAVGGDFAIGEVFGGVLEAGAAREVARNRILGESNLERVHVSCGYKVIV
eukprot:CAMPEP_0170187258 /NCGR_PEP_ID=MMETSP0040_2-20121228/41258_1 /TAXON_ID=641309 /ORGANISM="Lotharella oceanica, Strain CCMP622" /LENGTH=110 /DNA_ID=CAMNT_0010434255 /DNA_START=374 /DNA_END=706 /DNA_ORIENTATION=+